MLRVCFVISHCLCSFEPSDEKLHTAEEEPCLGGQQGGFEVLGEAAVAVEPSQGAFDHPASGQRFETLRAVRAFDDVQGPLPTAFQRRLELGTRIGAVGEDMAQPGEAMADGSEEVGRAVAVLDVGGMNPRPDQKTAGVGEDMTLAALHLLGRVKAPWAAAFRGLHRLAVDDAGGRAGRASIGLARRHQKMVIDARPQAVIAPSSEIAVHGAMGRKALGQQPPWGTAAKDVEDGVDHLPQIRPSRPPQPVRRRHVGGKPAPFRIGQIACVAQAIARILQASDFSPHVVPPWSIGHNKSGTTH